MVLRPLLLGLALQALVALAQPPDETDYTPIVVPLAVRSPYVGAYLTGRQDKNLALMDPHFWTTTPLGWKGLLRVDGEVWNWMGNLTDWPAAVNSSFTHKTAESIFTLTNDPPTVALTASFLSPITPADLFRQSLPFSYLRLSVESLDGKHHQVEAYSEVNGLWLADDETEEMEWESKEEKEWTGLRYRLENQRLFEEEQITEGWTADRILHGDMWYAAQTGSSSPVKTTFSAGDDAISTRHSFASTGTLGNTLNSTFRPTRTRASSNLSQVLDEPVFAFSHSFGTVSPSSSISSRSALLAIGHVRDPVVEYMTAGEVVAPLRPLWRSTFSSTESLLSFFFRDYADVLKLSDEFNAKLYADAREVDGQEYGHVVAVSTRQIFMALEAVWDESEEGRDGRTGLMTYSPITGLPVPTMMMLKEVSSNGNANTLDVIAPFLPFMLYATPSLLPLLLEPTLRYSATGLYAPIPPPHDIGDHYPSAIGHNDFLYPGLPLEEAANCLCLALAGMRVADPRPYSSIFQGARTWLDEKRGSERIGWRAIVGKGKDHRREGARMAKAQAKERYALLKSWANYLEQEALYPGTQSSTDDFFGPAPNQTSLVIKGIMGLRSMSEIAADLGETADRDHYRAAADRFVQTFLKLAVADDGSHLLSSYGNQSSWLTHYNLYYDKLLGTEQFPDSVYAMQDAFYPTIAEPYGPPLDSRFPQRAKTDWLLWAAGASSPGSSARRLLVDAVARYFRADKNAVFGDAITPQEGWSVGFLSRPVAGGHYSLLGLHVMAQERKRRLEAAQEWISEELFWAAIGVGAVLAGLVAGRAWRRARNGKRGYVELLAGRVGFRGRRRSAVGGEETIWLAETPESGSLFELGEEGEYDDDEGEGNEPKRQRGSFAED
ncbi:hypothetical protein JCM5296_000242 [Sporobolomyces johnsonii]